MSSLPIKLNKKPSNLLVDALKTKWNEARKHSNDHSDNEELENLDKKKLELHFYYTKASPQKFNQISRAEFPLTSLSSCNNNELNNTLAISPLASRKMKIKEIKKKVYNIDTKKTNIPPWLHPISIIQIISTNDNPTYGTIQLNDWLANYDHEVIHFESIASFAEIKLKEAIHLASKMETTPNHFRTSVCCNLLERIAYTMVHIPSLHKYSWLIYTLRDEILRSIYVNYIPLYNEDINNIDLNMYDKYDNTPRTLGYFMQLNPYFVELKAQTNKNQAEMLRHQAIFRRVIQSTYQSRGTVFQAWKMYVSARKEENINSKAASLTAKIMSYRGQCRLVYNAWIRFTYNNKLDKCKIYTEKLKLQHTNIMNQMEKTNNTNKDIINEMTTQIKELECEIQILKETTWNASGSSSFISVNQTIPINDPIIDTNLETNIELSKNE